MLSFAPSTMVLASVVALSILIVTVFAVVFLINLKTLIPSSTLCSAILAVNCLLTYPVIFAIYSFLLIFNNYFNLVKTQIPLLLVSNLYQKLYLLLQYNKDMLHRNVKSDQLLSQQFHRHHLIIELHHLRMHH